MLSLLMLSRDDMNRSEQESLYRTSRKLSLVPMDAVHSRRASSACLRGAQDGAGAGGEDLVLSVLKSPVNHIGAAGTMITTEKLDERSECDEEVDSEEEGHRFSDGNGR